MRDAAGSPRSLLLTASDITESKRQEAVFLRAQRMDSIGSLTSGVAHDLNNVLSPIMMSVELLRPLAVRPEDREVIRLLSDSVRRGADVVRQLLLFGRGSEGPGETIEISTVFKEIIRMMRETFPRNLTIGGQISRDVWTVRGYPTQIYQILLNLCVNARDAMPTGGTLNVDACNRHLDAAAVRLQPGAKPGRYVELTVTDTGTGIPAEIVDKIFDPFFTTKERGQGSGLGLSTVLGIAKGFGGFVNVTSRVGAGSEFKVFLPASGDLGEATAETKTEAWRGHGETVLVVDDEEGIRMVVARLLIASGYRVLEAANGGNALILARAHRADLRAVVLDMMMPGLDGLQVVAALREFAPDLPIVACSGLDRYRDELVKQGFTRVCFLTKPILADSLRQALRALLDGKPDPFAAANLPTL
jgi:nitrogen-specific signal transduction histidine kinase/ActR/RegA family two-component response regulator